MTAEEELAILKKKIADDREYKRKEAAQTAEENWRKAETDIDTGKVVLWLGSGVILLGIAALMRGEFGWGICTVLGIGMLIYGASTISKAKGNITTARAKLRSYDPDNYRFETEKILTEYLEKDE